MSVRPDGPPEASVQVPRWRLNPRVRFYPFDSRKGNEWLVELDDEAGRTHRMVVSSALHDGLQRLATPSSLPELDAGLAAEGWTPEAISSLLASLRSDCAQRRLVVPADDAGTPARRQIAKPRYMAAMIPLLPPSVVNPLARALSPLFSRGGALAGLVAGASGLALLFIAMGSRRDFSPAAAEDVLLAIALGAAALLLHELGHAAAAWREGARKVSIGVGWYAVFPVAYADLSEVWRLPARRRIAINLAGVFMQGMALLVLMLAYRAFDHAAFLAAAAGTAASMLWNLNPLMRLDGYWVLSDLLRTTDLRAEAMRALRGTWARMRGRADPAGPGTLGALPPLVAGLLATYALACTAFFAVVVVVALARFSGALGELANAWMAAWQGMAWLGGGWAEVTVILGATAWKLVLVWFLGRFLLSMTKAGATWLRARFPVGAREPT